jgi:hypothetical protein
VNAVEQIVGRERRERVSQLAWCGGGCFEFAPPRQLNRSRVIAILKTQLQPLGCDGSCAGEKPRGFSIGGCVIFLLVRESTSRRTTCLLTENQ